MRYGTVRRQSSLPLIASAMVVMAAGAWHASAFPQTASPPSSSQSSNERGVTVKVTLRPSAPGATEWEFTVVLDTHSEALSDDMAKTALLVVDGREVQPIRWTGAEPGGHHREGVLKFPAARQPVKLIELRVLRIGEATPRVFRWDGAALN